MIDFLLSVPGRCTSILNGVNILLTRISATQSSYIDAAISSRAPANTALLRTVWTDARAAALDTISALASNITTLLSNPVMTAPTAFFVPTITSRDLRAIADCDGLRTQLVTVSTASTWETVINENGRGCVNFLAFYRAQVLGGGTMQARFTIDGVVCTLPVVPAQQGRGYVAIGATAYDSDNNKVIGLTFDKIPFFTGFKVEVQGSVGDSSDSLGLASNYYRTG